MIDANDLDVPFSRCIVQQCPDLNTISYIQEMDLFYNIIYIPSIQWFTFSVNLIESKSIVIYLSYTILK